ncbi:MAG: cyclic nucleotide-binding domain-containing protein [Gammaproteobacteria bacterium]
MDVHDLESYLAGHAFFAGLAPHHLALLTGCAGNVRFEAGQGIFSQGGAAENFYLLRAGRVALEFPRPAGGGVVIDTLHAGDVLGASWLVAPYRWPYDARAVTTTRALALDAVCLRRKCDEDAVLGYDLSRRFAAVIVARLHAAELRLTDMYANPAGAAETPGV